MKEQDFEPMGYRHPDSAYKKDSRSLRMAVGIGLPIAGLVIAFFFWRYSPAEAGGSLFSLFCPFNRLTGLYCPFCGMMRAAHELLNFNIIKGIRDNALIVLLVGPLAAYFLFREFIHYLFDRKILPAPAIRKWMTVTLLVIAVLFTLLRNIPMFPFLFLAPLP